MSSPLRFAMVTTFYPPYHFGGDGMYVERLAHALAALGHEVEVIHDLDAYRIGGGKPKPARPQPKGVQLHTLQTPGPALGKAHPGSRLATLGTQQLGRPLVHGNKIRQILERDFDVIHYHNISLVGGPGVLEYGNAVKLYTAHEHWLVCPTHILWRYNREPCTGRECLRCVLQAGRPPQLWRNTGYLDQMARNVDEFLALSQFSAEKHREFGFSREMRVFPSFLPDADDSLVAPPKSRTPPYFLFVGRLELIKGLDDVIPVFDANMPAQLWIAGDGTERQRLEALAAGRPNVRFLGHLRPDELRALYRDAIACVTPSRCYEVFPLVVLEAFREGTPIVARRLGPFPEVVDKSGAGLLFTSQAELRSQLYRLATEPALRSELGQAGREAFAQHWSQRVVLERYFSLIREVAERRGMSSLLSKLHGMDSAESGPRAAQ